MALAGVDTGGLGSYSEATAADPTLIALRDKVEFDFQNGRPNTLAELELVLTDGRACRHAMIPAFPRPISTNRAGGSRRNSPRWPNRFWAARRRAT